VSDLDDFLVHATTVERLSGSGPDGDTLAVGVTLNGFIEHAVKLVRNPAGDEVVSSATIYYPPGTAFIPTGSFITPPAGMGSRARVISCAIHDSGPLDLPEHVEVTVE